MSLIALCNGRVFDIAMSLTLPIQACRDRNSAAATQYNSARLAAATTGVVRVVVAVIAHAVAPGRQLGALTPRSSWWWWYDVLISILCSVLCCWFVSFYLSLSFVFVLSPMFIFGLFYMLKSFVSKVEARASLQHRCIMVVQGVGRRVVLFCWRHYNRSYCGSERWTSEASEVVCDSTQATWCNIVSRAWKYIGARFHT